MRIERAAIDLYALPYRREITWANAVERAGVFALLTLFDADGASGIAEGTLKATWSGVSPRSLVAALEDVLLPRLFGHALASPAAAPALLDGVPENRLAKAMIDNALHDLAATRAGMPCWRAWGGAPRVELAWALTRQPPQRMAAEAAGMCARYGFRTLKVKGGQGRDTDLAALAAIRAAVGGAVTLYVDANGAYARDEALAYTRAIAEAGAVVSEDPSPLAPDAAFAALQAASPLPVLIDRSCVSLEDAERYFERGARALSAKPGRIGLSEARRVADAARARGARIALGLYAESALGTLASLQFDAALDPATRLVAAEQTFYLEMDAQVTQAMPPIIDGAITLPEAPSLAALVDRAALARHRL